MTPAKLVTNLLGVRPLARKLKTAPSTIIRWRYGDGLVPSKYQRQIINISEGRISAEDIVFGR